MFEAIDVSVDRHDLQAAVRTVYEEVRHYRLLADILEEITGEKPNPTEMFAHAGTLKQRAGHPDLPALTDHVAVLKKLHEEHGELTETVLTIFEGGGAAIFYSGSKILDYPFVSYSNGAVERKIAAAMEIIFEDEMRHGPAHIPKVAARLRTDDDFAIAETIIEKKGKAHLRLRNETFGYPLSEARMREIDAGVGIQPLPIDYRRVSAVSPYSA
jgi:hypothetical protein